MKKHPAFKQAHDILRNGGDLPAKTTNQLLAGMMAEVFQVACEGLEISQDNATKLDGICESPSLEWYFKNETGKVITLFSGLIGGVIALWFILHSFAHIPAVQIWIMGLLKIPTP